MKVWVRAYNGQGFGSGFIKRFTFGDFSHVSLVFEICETYEEIESIQGKGVIRHRPYSHKDKDFVEFQVPLTEEQVFTAHIEACTLVGASYDYKGIWGFMVRKDRHSKDRFFCSEFVAYVLLKCGYPLSRREPYRETPTSIAETLRIFAPVEESGGA